MSIKFFFQKTNFLNELLKNVQDENEKKQAEIMIMNVIDQVDISGNFFNNLQSESENVVISNKRKPKRF